MYQKMTSDKLYFAFENTIFKPVNTINENVGMAEIKNCSNYTIELVLL